MTEKDRPLTKGDLQTILDAIRNGNRDIDNRLDSMENRLENVENDVETIASVFGFDRDPKDNRLRRK